MTINFRIQTPILKSLEGLSPTRKRAISQPKQFRQLYCRHTIFVCPFINAGWKKRRI